MGRCRGVSPEAREQFLFAQRGLLKTYLFGAVNPALLVPTTITRNVALPVPCPVGIAQLDEYSFADVGGRGGAGRVHLAWTSAAWNGVLAICCAGHQQFWSQPSMDSVVAYFLAQGCHVLCIDMPHAGLQGETITLLTGGIPVVYGGPGVWWHNYAALDGDGGPNSTRVFQDMVLGGINQAIVDVAPSFVFGMGHSGGGMQMSISAALDVRIRASYVVFGTAWWPWTTDNVKGTSGGMATDWDTYRAPAGNQLFVAETGGWELQRRALAASDARRTVQIVADLDTVFPTAGLHYDVSLGEWVIRAKLGNGGSFAVMYDPTAINHDMTAWTSATIWADVAALL